MINRFLVFLAILTLSLLNTAKAEQSFNETGQANLLTEEGQTTKAIVLCSYNIATMSSCRSFITGFLQGALLTDTAIIDSYEGDERSFFKRAMRTRLSTREDTPTEKAGFCLPSNRTMTSLVDEISGKVKTSPENSAELAQNVYRFLKKDYPCNE